MVRDVIWNKYEGVYKSELDYLVHVICLSDVTKNCIHISPIHEWDYLPERKTLFGKTTGLPIGNICSQLFANLYLNNFDHLIKSRHKSYSRYVDDIIIVDTDLAKLQKTLSIIERYLLKLNLSINHDKTIITEVKYGINYLGVIIRPYYKCLSKRRIKRLYNSSNCFNDVYATRYNICYRNKDTKRGVEQ